MTQRRAILTWAPTWKHLGPFWGPLMVRSPPSIYRLGDANLGQEVTCLKAPIDSEAEPEPGHQPLIPCLPLSLPPLPSPPAKLSGGFCVFGSLIGSSWEKWESLRVTACCSVSISGWESGHSGKVAECAPSLSPAPPRSLGLTLPV